MADKIKKISINAFEDAVDKGYVKTSDVEWRGLTITVNQSLSLSTMMTFVDSVVKSCFEQENGTYIPEIKDFAIRNCIIEHYTNISLPSNIERRYDLLYHSDLLNHIMPRINRPQFDEMMNAIDDKIAHLAQSNIDAITKQVNALYESIEKMVNQFGNAFDGIDREQVNEFMSAVTNGKLDEEQIVRAIMKERRNEHGEA